MPLGLFALALGVRLVGLTWGLPSALHFYSYHPDERQIAVAVANLDFFGGDFNPDFFSYPSLYIYLVYVAHFLGSGLGLFSAPPTNNVVWPFLREVMLMGRFVSAMLGAATVPLIFFIGKRIGGARLGALAALLLAFLPGYVQHSHFATVDVTATFFVALCLLFVARALDVENPQRHKQIYYAALFAGLAAATKYNAGLVFVAVLAAWWLARGEEKHTGRDLAILPALALLGFFIGCPFSIFDFSAFWGDGKFQGVYYELFVHSRIGHGLAFTQTGDGWWYHLTFNLPFAMTWPILLASLAGLVSLLRRRDQMALPMIAFTLFYFASLGFSQVRFLRYLLPILPVLCLCAAACFWPLMETSPRRRLLAAVSSALLFFALVGTFDALYPFVRPDPRDQAAAWMRLSPQARWAETMRIAAWHHALGGTSDPDPDPASPFYDPDVRRPRPVDGGAGLRVVRRGRV